MLARIHVIVGNNLKRPRSYFEAIWITKKENQKKTK